MGYKIIDYAGETLADGFECEGAAWYWLCCNYSKTAIKELEFEIREEEEDEQSEI